MDTFYGKAEEQFLGIGGQGLEEGQLEQQVTAEVYG
jgi:hypothetical protein